MIRSRKNTKHGDGISCDHIVSHQPGLTPQSLGKLTYARLWESALYIDAMSDYIYNNLVHGVSSEETLEPNLSYERVLASYGMKV